MANAKKLGALGGMLGILALAWWFDRLFEFARLGGPSTGDPVPPVVWVSVITNWALAGLVLLLAWFVIFKRGECTGLPDLFARWFGGDVFFFSRRATFPARSIALAAAD